MLFPAEKQIGKLNRAWQLIRNPSTTGDKANLNPRKIAVEVAGNLGTPGSVSVLKSAALHSEPDLRTAAVRHAFQLWQREPRAGFEILDYIAGQVMDGLVPNVGAFETLLGLSLSIFFPHSTDVPVLGELQRIWRVAINSIFLIRESGGPVGNAARKLIRDRVLSVAITYSFKVLREMPDYNPINYEDAAAFWKLAPEEKELFRRLNRYLDPEGAYDRAEMERDLLAAIDVRNLHLEGAVCFVLISHAMHHRLGFLPFLRTFIDAAISNPVPNGYLNYVPIALGEVLTRNPNLDAYFDCMADTIARCQQYYSQHRRIPGLSRVSHAPAAGHMNIYIHHQYRRSGTVKTEWYLTRVEAALAQGDEAFFAQLLTTDLVIIGVEFHMPQTALEALSVFVKENRLGIREHAIALLARMRRHSPDEVDDFLEEQDLDDDFRLQVQTNEPAETVGELIGLGLYEFVVDSLDHSPALRGEIADAFAQAADAKDIRPWIEHVFRRALRLVYGTDVLGGASNT